MQLDLPWSETSAQHFIIHGTDVDRQSEVVLNKLSGRSYGFLKPKPSTCLISAEADNLTQVAARDMDIKT